MLVDSHCHLDFADFAPDLDPVLARAEAAGVGTMLTICTHLSRFPQVRALAERYPQVYCTVGIHPHEAASEEAATPETLCALAEHPRVVGFGETGLDYFYQHSPCEAQQRSFRHHLAAARRMGLPVVVHTRDADADTARLLREECERAGAPLRGVLHCFSSTPELAKTAIELGFYLSFSGIVTFKKAEALRAIVAATPLDHILVETDAPYLAPVPHRGRRNEPAFVRATAAVVAEQHGIALDELARRTTANFFRLFDKARPPCA